MNWDADINGIHPVVYILEYKRDGKWRVYSKSNGSYHWYDYKIIKKRYDWFNKSDYYEDVRLYKLENKPILINENEI